MYNHAPENYVCPLCQIAKGEVTSRGSQEEAVIFRDARVTAFIAGLWWRSNPGHVIVIPNIHQENIYEIKPGLGGHIFDLTRQVAIALKHMYVCDGVTVRQNNEPAGGQDTWHYHVHVIPRMTDDHHYDNLQNTYWPAMDEKRPYADKLRDFLQK
jgi:histidine triad (HIT) family protein